jgi:YVTN family beta-propeller protein
VTPLGTVPVGVVPVDVAVGEGSAWVANSGDGTVTRIDAAGRVTATIPVGGALAGIAVGERLVWVAVD